MVVPLSDIFLGWLGLRFNRGSSARENGGQISGHTEGRQLAADTQHDHFAARQDAIGLVTIDVTHPQQTSSNDIAG
jgi:hypothetical protein